MPVDLNQARADLQAQVDRGAIQPWQMEAELRRLEGQSSSGDIDLNRATADLQAQVDRGAIQPWQMEAELNRLRGLGAGKGPILDQNISLDNPRGALEGQAAANEYAAQQQSQYNRVDEVGPYGSAKYQTDEAGNVTRETTLSPH